MSSEIRHLGVIENISEERVRVRILQTSACAACKIASRCNASEAKEKIVEVHSASAAKFRNIGDHVMVCTSRGVISKAMRIGFVLPFLLMVFTLIVAILVTGSELKAGLLSVGVLVPYYLVVWMLRDRIGRQVSFYLED